MRPASSTHSITTRTSNRNPDYFYTYHLATSAIRTLPQPQDVLQFPGFKTNAASYLDNFWGYDYDNIFGLSDTWGKVTATISYENGGFTDNGDFSLWYIDDYRRIARFSLSYAF